MPPWSLVLITVLGSGPSVNPAREASLGDPAVSASALAATAPIRFMFDPGAMQGEDPVTSEERDPVDAVAAPIVPLFGTQGSSRWYIHYARGAEFDTSENSVSLLGVGYSYFIGRAISLDVELNGAAHSQIGEDAGGVNINLLFRWHCIVERDWTFFLDAGAGAQYTNEDVPRLGSKFNWTPQAGLGVSFDVGRDTRILLGCRWHHQSNANIFDTNPGRDSFLGYVELNFPF